MPSVDNPRAATHHARWPEQFFFLFFPGARPQEWRRSSNDTGLHSAVPAKRTPWIFQILTPTSKFNPGPQLRRFAGRTLAILPFTAAELRVKFLQKLFRHAKKR